MTTTLRDATDADLDFISWVELTASRSHLTRGIWEYMNDQDEADTLAFLRRMATTDTAHLLHHSLFLVAEVDGEPAAAMCAYESETQGFAALGAELPRVAGESGVSLEDPEFGRRMGVLISGFAADTPNPGPRWVIENVATRPEFRRQGLSAALLRELFDRGRDRGYDTAQISVFIDNTPAREAYLAAGFEVVAEQRSDSWTNEIGCPGSEMLLRSLT